MGTASTELSSQAFRDKLRGEIPEFLEGPSIPRVWQRLEERIYYVAGSFDDPAAYERLREQLAEVDRRHGTAATTSTTSRCRPTSSR